MSDFVLYITQQGDRWDVISKRHYGTFYEYERIIAANPTVAIRPVLAQGIALAIPLIERSNTISPELLPPWKR